jgi:hypothetical protein
MSKEEKMMKVLECRVSATEIADRKNRLVSVDRSILSEIAIKREEMAEHNKVLRELREEQENLISAVERGIEKREIACVWKQNDRLHKKELIRTDTGAVVDEEPQTLSDKQEDLFDGKPKKGKRIAVAADGSEKPATQAKKRALKPKSAGAEA